MKINVISDGYHIKMKKRQGIYNEMFFPFFCEGKVSLGNVPSKYTRIFFWCFMCRVQLKAMCFTEIRAHTGLYLKRLQGFYITLGKVHSNYPN
jgi:hypothetical protein